MGKITFLATELLILGAMIYIVPFFSVCLMTIFFMSLLYFYFGTKKIIYYLFPILFLIRIFFSVNLDFNKESLFDGEIKRIETNIVNGRGKAKTIDNKFFLENINLYISETEDGKYIVYGKLEHTKYNNFSVEVLQKEKLQENIFEKFFKKRMENIREHLSNKCGNFLHGVILGERRYIYKNIRDKFIYSGSAHLLAISGLHIGAVIGLILQCVNLFKIKREARYLLAFLFLSIYVAGINTSPSVVRAYIMGGVFLLGKIFYEKIDMKKSLSLAVILNLFLYPVSLGDISFIFSYLCLFTIIYIYPKCRIKRECKHKNILNFFIFTGVIQIFMIPVTIYFFKKIAMLSYFTNFVLTPLGMIFVTVGFVSFFMSELIFALIFAPILEMIYGVMEIILNLFAKIPFLTVNFSHNNLSLKFLIFIYIILTALFYFKEIRKYFSDTNRKQEKMK